MKVNALFPHITVKNPIKGNLKSALTESGITCDQFPVINIVGTNGKGSCASALMQILKHYYKKVGLFSSPAIFEHNERIIINDTLISDEILYRYQQKYQMVWADHSLIFFEIWTFIMIDFFNRSQIDIAIIEAGIGGKYDSTRVLLDQKAVLLTSIAKDHTKLLGDTIQEICANKVGILHKKNTPLLTCQSNWQYRKLILQLHSYTFFVKKQVCLNGPYTGYVDNLLLVKIVCEYFKWNFNNLNLQHYLPPGRFVQFKTYPNWIIDGAHNEDAIKKLLVYATHKFNNQPFKILFASSCHKNYYDILSFLKSKDSDVYLTNFKHNKTWDIKTVSIKLPHINHWERFLKTHQDQRLLICGSLYFVGQIISFIKNNIIII